MKDWSQVKFGDAKAFRKFFNFLLKCESVSDNQHWNALDTPEVYTMHANIKVSWSAGGQME